jgi:transposase
VHREALRTWIRQAEIDGGQRPGVSTAEQRRIAELDARTASCAAPTRS